MVIVPDQAEVIARSEVEETCSFHVMMSFTNPKRAISVCRILVRFIGELTPGAARSSLSFFSERTNTGIVLGKREKSESSCISYRRRPEGLEKWSALGKPPFFPVFASNLA